MNFGRSAGFSLIEVVVAIAVLGVILVAVAGLMTGNLGLRRTSTQSTEAVQLGASYLESVKRSWSVLDNYVSGELPGPPSDPRASRYSFTVEVDCLDLSGTFLPCSANPVLRQVAVSVADTRGSMVERLVTQIGRPFEPRSDR